MPELRKETCSLCGWNEFIARTVDLAYLPPRIGFKEVKTCIKCDALSKSDKVWEVQEFNGYWEYAIRGTKLSLEPSITPKEAQKLAAKANPYVKFDREAEKGAAVTNFDQNSHPTPETVKVLKTRKMPKFTYRPPEIPTDARRAYAKGWVRGLITGLMIATGVAMTLYRFLH